MRAALRKLMRALPESMRTGAAAASSAVVVDSRPWGRTAAPRSTPQHLDAVQRAVIEGAQVRLGYTARDRSVSSRVVHPLGLATKGSVWYLVAATDAGLRTFRVDRVTDVEPTGEAVVRPDGFDLEAAWRMISERVDELRAPVAARASADPAIVGHVRAMLGTRVRIGPLTEDGRVHLELRGHSHRSLAAEIAGWGRGIEVHDPDGLRAHLEQLGRELVSTYAPRA